MRLLSKFIQLDPLSRRLLLKASFLSTAFWILLHVLPFPTVYVIMEKLVSGRGISRLDEPNIVSQIIWALSAASRRLLGKDTCLPQAMAARVMFNRFGVPAKIKFGVKKSAGGELQAHAWVINGDVILIGGDGLDLASYSPLNHVNRTMP